MADSPALDVTGGPDLDAPQSVADTPQSATDTPKLDIPTPDVVDADGADSGSICKLAGEFGCPCDTDEDCDSGYCVDDGAGAKVCTKACAGPCPAGWQCTLAHWNSYVCKPAWPGLCYPCTSDSECQSGGACMPAVPGSGAKPASFCGAPCHPESVASGDGCPTGTACTEWTPFGDSSPTSQCFPVNGTCECMFNCFCGDDADCATPDPCRIGKCTNFHCQFKVDSAKPDCCSAATNPKCDDKDYFTTDCCAAVQPGGWKQCTHGDWAMCP